MRGMLAAFLTTILFSISAVCAQRTTRLMGGLSANFYRIVMATVLLALWAHLCGRGFAGQGMPYFFLSGIVGFGLGDIALYQALPRLGSRLSVLLIQCLPVPLAAAAEWLWLGTPLHLQETVAAGIIVSGVALALAPGGHWQGSRRMLWEGVVYGAIAALGQGGGALLSRKAALVALAAGETTPDGLTAAYQRIWGGLIVAALFWIGLVWRRQRQGQSVFQTPWWRGGAQTAASRGVWWWVLANAVAGPAVGVGCYQWALMQKGTGIVLPIVALTPIVIIPFARAVEGEKPTVRSLVGGVIAVVGAVLMTLASGR